MPVMNTAKASPFSRSYNSFSGVDIRAVFGNKPLTEIQALSYSVTREKAPIFTMGSADARAFSRGKRGIAGTLVFIMFDTSVILGQLGGFAPDGGLFFQSDTDDIRPEFRYLKTVANNRLSDASMLTSTSGRTAADDVSTQESPLTSISSDQELARAWYADQIPPFDITLAAANEYGALAVMRIFGVEILNEGYGVSIDDIVSEQQHTYVARSIVGWSPLPSVNRERIASQGISVG
jgi:hypothetical protein